MIIYPSEIKPKNPAILFIHGWKGDHRSSIPRAELLAQNGYICSLFDLPAHGASAGSIEEVKLQELLDAVIKAYDDLVSLPEVDNNNISLVSVSLGCYLALLLSEKRKVSKIVLRAPADYPNNGFDKPLSQMAGGNNETYAWRELPKNPDDTYTLKALSHFDGQVYLVESEKDDRVPHQAIENYSSAIKDKDKLTHVLIPGAGHSLNTEQNKEFVALLLQWFPERKIVDNKPETLN